MKSMLTTKSAGETIKTVSKDCDVETGGVLIGILSDPIVILGAGLPGDDAVHKACSFTTDPKADECCLLEHRGNYGPKVEICGWYHKHTSLQTPSMGDHLQAVNLKKEFDDGRPIIMGIVSTGFLIKSKLRLRFFGLDANDEIMEFDSRIIADNSSEITKALESIPDRPEIEACDYWKENSFQFYKSAVGRKRICDEILQLKEQGLKVTAGRSKCDHTLVIDIANNSASLQLTFPPEFPLNSPRVSDSQGNRLVGLTAVKEWNSKETLPALVKEAFSSLDN